MGKEAKLVQEVEFYQFDIVGHGEGLDCLIFSQGERCWAGVGVLSVE